MAREASVNSDARSPMEIIGGRVAQTQVKYHRWAKTDRNVRFGDLFNLVHHPGFLLVAWEHVVHNKGARTAGIDGVTVRQIIQSGRVGAFLARNRLRPQGRHVLALAGASGADSETGREVPSAGYPDARRPGRAAVVEDGAGADFRGRLRAGLLRVPAQAASP
jgi:hypothetical protein